MREAVLSSKHQQENSKDVTKRKNYAKRWKYVLVISISIALLFSGTGLIISGFAYLGLIEHARVLSRIGTIMIVVSAPLFILSAHCLDEIRFEEKRSKKTGYSKDFDKNNFEDSNLYEIFINFLRVFYKNFYNILYE